MNNPDELPQSEASDPEVEEQLAFDPTKPQLPGKDEATQPPPTQLSDDDHTAATEGDTLIGGRIAQNWEVHEPRDLRFATPHLDARDAQGSAGWRLSGASRRGKQHAHDGKYREDAWQVGVSRRGGWSIVAVADGGGSYQFARVGAALVTQRAVEALQANLPEPDGEILESAIRGAVDAALAAAYQSLNEEAATIAKEYEEEITSRDLSTTLLLAALCPQQAKLVVAQVGDGWLALQKQDGSWVSLAQSDSGASANQVVFLNNLRAFTWGQRIRIFKLSELPRLIVAMTDGVADDVLESEHNTRVLFAALNDFIGQAHPAEVLKDWLGYEKRASFDDRTLVVLYPQPTEAS